MINKVYLKKVGIIGILIVCLSFVYGCSNSDENISQEVKKDDVPNDKIELSEQTNAEPIVESNIESTTEVKQESDTETKSETTEDTKVEPTEETKSETNVEIKSESTEDTKVESNVEIKSETTEVSTSEPVTETKQESVSNANINVNPASGGFKFKNIVMGNLYSNYSSQLGGNKDFFEAESCAAQGIDRTYSYNGFNVTTFIGKEKGSPEIVSSILLTDDTIATEEGVFIGDTRDIVRETYGEPKKVQENTDIYIKGKSKIIFVYKDDGVISIEYAYIF